MNIIQKAYFGLYNKEIDREVIVKYSGKFSSYNANVKYTSRKIEFHLSKDWRGVSEEIRIGLFQHLIAKLFKTKRTTMNMDMYEYFVKNIHIALPKKVEDATLQASFDRVNDDYFDGLFDKPSIGWGSKSKSQLGLYDYHTDTIRMSAIFKNAPDELIDCVMYHELLHKKHKFKSTGTRSHHHTRAFREDEHKFKDYKEIEKKLSRWAAKHKIKSWFWG